MWWVLAVALLLLAAVAWWRGFDNRLFGSRQQPAATNTARDLGPLGTVPDFVLVSQNADTVRTADLHGHIWIADFIFTHCPSTCPMMTAQLDRLTRVIRDETVRFVSFSVDPERDTPERLTEYAKGWNADPERWLFLTGDRRALYSLIADGFKLSVQVATGAEVAAGSEPILHSTRFVLVDAHGVIRGYYNGIDDAALNDLAEDVERLQSQAGS